MKSVIDRIADRNAKLWELLSSATPDARKRELVDELFPDKEPPDGERTDG